MANISKIKLNDTTYEVEDTKARTDIGDVTTLRTTAKDSLVKAVNECFQSASDGKALIASAITGKGVNTSSGATFAVMANNIASIPVGVDTSDATATAGQILSGSTAYVKGSKVTGTMANKSGTTEYTATAALDTTNSELEMTVPATGYYTTSNKLKATFATIASLIGLTSAKLASGNTILGIAGNSNVVDTSAGTATAAQILTGQIAYVDGVKLTGSMVNQGAVTSALNAGASYTIPAGYHNGSGKVTANSLASQTSGTATASQILSGYTAFVNGNKVTGNIAVDPNIMSGTNHIECDDVITVGAFSNDAANRIYIRPLYSQNNPMYLSADKWYTVTQQRLASALGITADKIMTGNVICGVTGNATGGIQVITGNIQHNVNSTDVVSLYNFHSSGSTYTNYRLTVINYNVPFVPKKAILITKAASDGSVISTCIYDRDLEAVTTQNFCRYIYYNTVNSFRRSNTTTSEIYVSDTHARLPWFGEGVPALTINFQLILLNY